MLRDVDRQLIAAKKKNIFEKMGGKTKRHRSVDLLSERLERQISHEPLSSEELAAHLSKIVHKQKCTTWLTIPLRIILAVINLILFLFGLCLFAVGIWGAIDQRFDGISSGLWKV